MSQLSGWCQSGSANVFFPVVSHRISLVFSSPVLLALLIFLKTRAVSRGFGGVLNHLGFKDFT